MLGGSKVRVLGSRVQVSGTSFLGLMYNTVRTVCDHSCSELALSSAVFKTAVSLKYLETWKLKRYAMVSYTSQAVLSDFARADRGSNTSNSAANNAQERDLRLMML